MDPNLLLIGRLLIILDIAAPEPRSEEECALGGYHTGRTREEEIRADLRARVKSDVEATTGRTPESLMMDSEREALSRARNAEIARLKARLKEMES